MGDIELTWDEVMWESEEVDDVHDGTWRWGELRTRVFLHDGKTYAVSYRTQPEMGIEDVNFGMPEVHEVEKKEKVIYEWVRKTT